MPQLHMSKVAVGCASVETLARRQAARVAGDHVPILTRFRPKRADEMIGSSIFWIIKHRLIARQTILGFDEHGDRRTIIRLDPALVAVRPLLKRAHQGWRYLAPEDAPQDFEDGDELLLMPARLERKLAGLGLI
jgi:hypothetical protein